jgi:N-acetyl-gamma-glutamyl-phosphate reductase common form
MISVGVVGASGYMGGEALRVLHEHPEVELAWATSRKPGPVEEVHPNFYGLRMRFVDIEEVEPPDFVFLALPTAPSIRVAARFLDAGSRVVDLGSAFRLRDRATWESVYGQAHERWDLAREAVYGISELHETGIRKARLVANPGCFSSAAILAMAPLTRAGLVDLEHLVVDGLSGTAGAGAELARAIHHPEIGDNAVTYNIVGHRHTCEMEQELGLLAQDTAQVHFTSTYIPIVRGIVDVCHCFPNRAVRRGELLELYRDFYRDQPFVQVFDLPRDEGASWQYKPYPWVSSVSGTNFCYIGLDVDEDRGRIVIVSVLDSMGKGGAHVGVENLNLMAGIDRMTGLTRRGSHPR